MKACQLKEDLDSNQKNTSVAVNVAPKSVTLVSLQSDRPKVIRLIHLFMNYI